MSIAFDLATARDVDELVNLRLAYLTEDFGELLANQRSSLAHELPTYLHEHIGEDLTIHVAREVFGPEEHTIVSCAWLLRVAKPPSPRFPHGRTGILFNVYTRKDRRHQGLARGVMRNLLEKARAEHLDVVELNATDDGYPLYLSLGFADDSTTHKPMRMVL
ncbi:MAG: GNAT family N-acetyltransferase [Atopobiaceae bacterium]|nr:GNAT family N-acetyltransferase [Atopobiaceae bacterium]